MKSCFVVMPIGDQQYGGSVLSKDDLRKKYDDLIKASVIDCMTDVDISRADDICIPGTITNDIFARLMHSDYVIVDITYPNPNVFYELGIRHAIRNKTILIKEKGITNDVFDISHLRYIEYENTPSGLKNLKQKLKEVFDFLDENYKKPDNQFLEYATLTKFNYPQTHDEDKGLQKKKESFKNLLNLFLSNPDLINAVTDVNLTDDQRSIKIIESIAKDERNLSLMISSLVDGNFIK